LLRVLCFQVLRWLTPTYYEKVSKLEAYITIQHIELMNIVIMITGSIVRGAYITELFIAWYSGVEYEQYAFLNRATGPYWAYL
jgi:molybdopterin-containing oxidoreductase family membrane subunit